MSSTARTVKPMATPQRMMGHAATNSGSTPTRTGQSPKRGLTNITASATRLSKPTTSAMPSDKSR